MNRFSPSAGSTTVALESGPQSELQSVYDEIDREVARLGPICELSGRCCRFREFGHTLFVSALELRYLVAGAPEPSGRLDRGDTCPWQDDRGRCTAREARPLGCRVFYCDPNYQEFAYEISERAIARIKQITQKWDLAWSYAPLHDQLFLERDEGRLLIELAAVNPEDQIAPRSAP
jgi:hypothetical protein